MVNGKYSDFIIIASYCGFTMVYRKHNLLACCFHVIFTISLVAVLLVAVLFISFFYPVSASSLPPLCIALVPAVRKAACF